MTHIGETHYANLGWDVQAAAERLRALERGSRAGDLHHRLLFRWPALVHVPGRSASSSPGTIGFYGWPVGQGRNDVPAPADSTGLMRSPVLGIFAGADKGIPADAVETFEEALSAAGVPNSIITYPGAPHSFFDRKAEDYAQASANAWDRVLEFIHGATPSA